MELGGDLLAWKARQYMSSGLSPELGGDILNGAGLVTAVVFT